MDKELRKEHQQFEIEIDLDEHGTPSMARQQLASRVYDDLKDSKWAKNLYEKCIHVCRCKYFIQGTLYKVFI